MCIFGFPEVRGNRITMVPVPPRISLLGRVTSVGVCLAILTGPANAAVAILANRTAHELSIRAESHGDQVQKTILLADEVATIPVPQKPAELVIESGRDQLRFRARANAVYQLIEGTRKIELEQIPVGESDEQPAPSDASLRDVDQHIAGGAITLKILVDDSEPAAQKFWESRLRRRVKEASDVIHRHCGIRFEVIAVETWTGSSTKPETPRELVEDFRAKVNPSPARLAIGYSRRYRTKPQDYATLGGLTHPLGQHILLPEMAGVLDEAGEVRLLVHELGHFLGASHSGEPTSVMRLDLGKAAATERRGRITFDPLNTLVMNLTAEELRRRGVDRLAELSFPVKQRIAQVYCAIAEALPNDNLAFVTAFLNLWGSVETVAKGLPVGGMLQRKGLDRVLDAIEHAVAQSTGQDRGDSLTEKLYRAAATAAASADLTASERVEAMLLGLGIVLDTTGGLTSKDLPAAPVQDFVAKVQRLQQAGPAGQPTMRGRYDLAQHFAVSGALVVIAGAQNAESAGMAKELWDSRSGGSGFSFVDLMADLTGVAFAEKLIANPGRLQDIAKGFAVGDYLPELAGLREQIPWKDLRQDYGHPFDKRFLAVRQELQRRIQSLPGHRPIKKPQFEDILLPDFPGAYAVWGAVGNDKEGRIWVGVSSEGVSPASAHLMEYDPASRQMTDRGNIVQQLRDAGCYREGEQQGLICSSIVRGEDGHLYFASLGEDGAQIDGSRVPPWGSHLWRVRLPERRWEHLAVVPEGLVAIAMHGDSLYALGYPDHVVYRYHLPDKQIKHAVVGAVGGHICRTLVCDGRGHLFVPRLTAGAADVFTCDLVELDPELREVRRNPFPDYLYNAADVARSRGIAGAVNLSDGSILLALAWGSLCQLKSTDSTSSYASTFKLSSEDAGEITSLACDVNHHITMAATIARAARDSSSRLILHDPTKGATVIDPIRLDPPLGMPQLWGVGAVGGDGAVYFAGLFPRGDLDIPQALLSSLRSRGQPEAKLQQLIENAKRTSQPILVSVRLDR